MYSINYVDLTELPDFFETGGGSAATFYRKDQIELASGRFNLNDNKGNRTNAELKVFKITFLNQIKGLGNIVFEINRESKLFKELSPLLEPVYPEPMKKDDDLSDETIQALWAKLSLFFYEQFHDIYNSEYLFNVVFNGLNNGKELGKNKAQDDFKDLLGVSDILFKSNKKEPKMEKIKQFYSLFDNNELIDQTLTDCSTERYLSQFCKENSTHEYHYSLKFRLFGEEENIQYLNSVIAHFPIEDFHMFIVINKSDQDFDNIIQNMEKNDYTNVSRLFKKHLILKLIEKNVLFERLNFFYDVAYSNGFNVGQKQFKLSVKRFLDV